MRWSLTVALLVGLCCAVWSQDESAEPSLDIMARSTAYEVGETKAIFCKLINLEDGDWLNPSGDVVGTRSAKNKRIFVEKKKEESGLLMPLIINKMEIADSGNWTCRSGDLAETIHVLVGRKVVMKSKETQFGNEGKTARLDCEPDGYPEPAVQWYKDRQAIEELGKKYVVHTKGRNRQLEIKNVDHMDTGEYVCKVTQKTLSHYTDKTITFIVNHSPVIVDPETQEENTASTQEVFTLLDRVKNLTCNAIAYPPPNFKWNKHNSKAGYDYEEIKDDVVKSEDGLSSVLQLRVFDESNLGQYKCTASNPHGHKFIIFDVRQGNKPNPPDLFSVVSSNSSSISFNLTCSTCVLGRPDEGYPNPQNLSVTGYKIQLTLKPKEATPDNWDEALTYSFDIEDVEDTVFTATNLTSSSVFHARACSVNEAGESEWFDLEGEAETSLGITLTPYPMLYIAAFLISLI